MTPALPPLLGERGRESEGEGAGRRAEAVSMLAERKPDREPDNGVNTHQTAGRKLDFPRPEWEYGPLCTECAVNPSA